MAETLDDVLNRLGTKVNGQQPQLLPVEQRAGGFFVADILDWALKDDLASMEHPFFSLSKTPDHKTRRYEHNGNTITIEPGAHGLATIWDKDILLYAVSQMVEAMNQDREVSRTVRLKAYDLLKSTNRPIGGEHYERLKDAFRRLKGTVIETNIVTGGRRIRESFSLIDNWRTVEKSPTDNRMIAVQVILNEWLFNAVMAREVLTLSRDYFRLEGGLERRLYELARKHCGQQATWVIGLDLLHKKMGSSAPLWRFRQATKALVKEQLLEYRLAYDEAADQVTVTRS